jgi:hypothetical protein
MIKLKFGTTRDYEKDQHRGVAWALHDQPHFQSDQLFQTRMTKLCQILPYENSIGNLGYELGGPKVRTINSQIRSLVGSGFITKT